LEHLQVARRFPLLKQVFLSSNLHTDPRRLKESLTEEILRAGKENTDIACLYGDCFPEIHDVCGQHSVARARGCHCYEILLGRDRFQEIIEETAGTYFLEKELLSDFERLCVEPLELHDREMRELFFKHYRRVIYVRQPLDPDLHAKAKDVSRFLKLSLEIRDADYSHLERELLRLIGSGTSGPRAG
jgi:Protein of unknown function (DUF1638)